MNARVQNAVTGRLSLRTPQAESLSRLVRAIAAAPELLGHQRELPAILASLKAEFPTLEDFEREFPSLCFALATGVGKTRLMGAFISYLHLAHGINNFFVLAPNLTIYNKLIAVQRLPASIWQLWWRPPPPSWCSKLSTFLASPWCRPGK